ncbi:MAG: AtpZ/AtpI family protein [Allosphingosinicella sp.]
MAGLFAGMSPLTVPYRPVPQENGMSENEPWQDPGPPEDARLTSLDKRLKQAQLEEDVRTGSRLRTDLPGEVQGRRVLSVMIGYPAGSALIGWLIDQLAGTNGIWVVMLFLGFGLAMREIWKISKTGPR